MDWNRLKTAGKPVVLYGMGNGAERLLAILAEKGIPVAGVFASDGFVRGQVFCGYRVTSCAEAEAAFGEMIVLVAFGTHLPEVMAQIDALAKRQELYVPDMPVVPGELFSEEFYRENREKLNFVRSRLADAQSVQVFDRLIAYRLSGKPAELRACETPTEEMYSEILRLGSGESYLDLGAYNGDTVAEFVRHAPDYATIRALEPDGYSFRRLKRAVGELPRCECFGCAVSDRPGTVLFAAKSGRGSAAGAGGREIPCESVDHLLAGAPVTYINMDVEGMEAAAICGAAETLRRWKPKLLAAAYHRSGDLFAIPLQVLEIRADYRVYLRHQPCYPAWDVEYLFV